MVWWWMLREVSSSKCLWVQQSVEMPCGVAGDPMSRSFVHPLVGLFGHARVTSQETKRSPHLVGAKNKLLHNLLAVGFPAADIKAFSAVCGAFGWGVRLVDVSVRLTHLRLTGWCWARRVPVAQETSDQHLVKEGSGVDAVELIGRKWRRWDTWIIVAVANNLEGVWVVQVLTLTH